MRASVLSLLALATCFSGQSTAGLPCHSDAACVDLACVAGVCGGEEPGPSYLRGLSVLFVVSDDPSAVVVQGRLARSVEAMVEKFSGRGLMFRIGVISTAMVHPLCGPGDDGALQFGSCRDSPEVSPDNCPAICSSVTGARVIHRATAVEPGGEKAVRPWVQVGPDPGDDNLNVPHPDEEGKFVPASQFVGCYLPRRSAGCRFEQPLAAVQRFLERNRDPDDPGYGFVGEKDLLAVVFVGRGPDCSHDPDSAHIFDPAGARVFWGDPLAEVATPAVCWSAGAACSNIQDDDTYFECHLVDRDAGGNPTDDPADAVLTPVRVVAAALEQRIVDELGGSVLIAGVLGAPGEPYRVPEPGDPLGLGPTCVNGAVEAVPPLRLQALADAFARKPAVSFVPVCDANYSEGLAGLADAIVEVLEQPIPDRGRPLQ